MHVYERDRGTERHTQKESLSCLVLASLEPTILDQAFFELLYIHPPDSFLQPQLLDYMCAPKHSTNFFFFFKEERTYTLKRKI